MEIFRKLVTIPNIKNCRVATDGAQELVTLKPLAKPPPINITVGEGKEKRTYTITITQQETIDPHSLLQTLRNTQNREPLTDEAVAVRILNLVMGALTFGDKRLAVKGQERNKIMRIDDGKIASDLGGGIECLRAFFTSVRLASGRILLNLNVNHSTFYRPGPLGRLFDDFRKVHFNDLDFLSRYLNRCRVGVTHLPKVMENGEMVWRQKVIVGLARESDGRAKNPDDKPPMKNPPRVPYTGANADEVAFFLEEKDSAGKSTGRGKYITVTRYFQERMYKHLPFFGK